VRRLSPLIICATWALQLAGCSTPQSSTASNPPAPQRQAGTAAALAAQPAAQGVEQAAVVKAVRANIRERPSASGAVVREVGRGDELALVSSAPTGAWYKVRHAASGSVGWVHGNTISLTRAQGAGAPNTQSAPTVRTSEPTAKAAPAPASGRSYVNVDGERVPSPVFSDSAPAGASARCRDGSYSFSRHRQGTCSYHGGVASWL
jgi:hypothetical protein